MVNHPDASRPAHTERLYRPLDVRSWNDAARVIIGWFGLVTLAFLTGALFAIYEVHLLQARVRGLCMHACCKQASMHVFNIKVLHALVSFLGMCMICGHVMHTHTQVLIINVGDTDLRVMSYDYRINNVPTRCGHDSWHWQP